MVKITQHRREALCSFLVPMLRRHDPEPPEDIVVVGDLLIQCEHDLEGFVQSTEHREQLDLPQALPLRGFIHSRPILSVDHTTLGNAQSKRWVAVGVEFAGDVQKEQ